MVGDWKTSTLTSDGERDLVKGMLAGDEQAFDLFAERYIPVLYRFASNRLRGDRELTREIVQTTLSKVMGKLASFRGDAALATWLCACCKADIATHFRRVKRQGREVELAAERVAASVRSNPAQPTGPEEALLRKEAATLVHMALDLLPGHYGKALEWKYLDDLPVKEIASRLRIGAKAAESLLTRARASFRVGYERLIAEVPASADPSQWTDARMGSES